MTNAELLGAISNALTKEFQKQFLKGDFSTTNDRFQGRPKKMRGSLSRLKNSDGTLNMHAVDRMTRRAVSALHHIKGNRRLRFYFAKSINSEAKTENVTAMPPVRIALDRDEIAFLFHIKAYA